MTNAATSLQLNTLSKLIILALITLVFSHLCYANSTALRPISAPPDYIYGATNAPVSIIMYSDFSCPYCKKLRLTLKKLVNNSSGQINWVYRHFPLEGNIPESMRQAQSIECAGKISGSDGFWALTHNLFNLPVQTSNNIDQRIALAARKSQLNVNELMKCLNNNMFQQRINADQKEAQSLGFTGTPGLVFINNKNNQTIVKQGALNLKNLTLFSQTIANK